MLVKLVLGDYSQDGHEKTREVIFISNVTVDVIKKAYKEAINQVGLDIARIAEEYEEPAATKKQVAKLKSAGYPYEEDIEEDGSMFFYTDSYIALYKWFIKQGNPEIELEEVNIPVAHGGLGYGLFS